MSPIELFWTAKNTTIERAKDYFCSVDMGRVYPALIRLLWSSTLLCPEMISASQLLLFSRCTQILQKYVIHVEHYLL